MHSSLKVFWLFNCFDGGSNIKTVKTKENGRCILDEMHASLLCFQVISHVTYGIENNLVELIESEVYQFVFMGARMTNKMLNMIHAL